MAKYVKLRNGKLAGSIGAGKTNIPTSPASLDSSTTSEDSSGSVSSLWARFRARAAERRAAYDALPLHLKNPMIAPGSVEVCDTCGGRIGYLDAVPGSLSDVAACTGHSN